MHELMLSFLIGVAASAAVGILIYFRQKREAEQTERSNFFLQYHQWKLTRDTKCAVGTASRNQQELLDEFHKLRRELTFALSQRRLESANSIAQQYEAVADEYGVLSVSRLLLRPPHTRRITLDLLRNIHFQMFPPDYEMGGTLRPVQNMIVDMSGGEPTVRYQPPPAGKVEELTKELLADWRNNYDAVLEKRNEAKVEAIATFHHRFLSIHPFLDGNGRIARLLLTLQMRELLDKSVKADWPRKEYYNALFAADGGDMARLVRIIEDVITDPAESGSRGFFSPSPHTTLHAGPHRAVHKGYRVVTG